MNYIDVIVDEVYKQLQTKLNTIPVAVSARHIHLSKAHVDMLFGDSKELTNAHDLYQPDHYLCNERLSIVGPKGMIQNVAIIGPTRQFSQVEISLTDAHRLGIDAPITDSGQIFGTPEIILINGDRSIKLRQGLIVARRHLHINPADAERLKVADGDTITVKMHTKRPLIFEDVLVRVRDHTKTCMHIDYDEANACGFEPGDVGTIVRS